MTGVMNMMLGAVSAASAYTVSITDQTITSTQEGVSTTANYRLGTDGIAYSITDDGGTDAITGEWLNPANATQADLYECYASIVSGSVSSGTTGSWIALSSDRTWAKTRSTIGSSTVVIDVSIRLASAPTIILGTARITITATMLA